MKLRLDLTTVEKDGSLRSMYALSPFSFCTFEAALGHDFLMFLNVLGDANNEATDAS